jgi:hypothetical protein
MKRFACHASAPWCSENAKLCPVIDKLKLDLYRKAELNPESMHVEKQVLLENDTRALVQHSPTGKRYIERLITRKVEPRRWINAGAIELSMELIGPVDGAIVSDDLMMPILPREWEPPPPKPVEID